MTPKQAERIKNKIKKIKAALAADKKQWGGQYHDGNGLRYLPPQLYIELSDYSGGLRYLNWFQKHFPDDCGFPDFLFEWTIILFETGRLKAAGQKAFKTFCSNTYLFDAFFGRPVTPLIKWETSNLESSVFATTYFEYHHTQANLTEFAIWLDGYIGSEKFAGFSQQFIELRQRLHTEKDPKKRSNLGKLEKQLLHDFISC